MNAVNTIKSIMLRILCGILSFIPLMAAGTQDRDTLAEDEKSAAYLYIAFDEKAGKTTVFPPLPEEKSSGPVVPAVRQPTGSMTGRIVFISPGHGWVASSSGVWWTQRGDNNELVEDLGNLDQAAMLAAYCFNAGAIVVPLRPVGYQPLEVVLDNDDPGVEFSGTWTDSAAAIYYGDAGDTISYRFTNSTTTGGAPATARYTPSIPATGFYPVYSWVRAGNNRSNDQLYRITHSGGVSEVRINHCRVGNGWVYLGTYHFERGTAGYLEISNHSTDTSAATLVVLADAIRFGNGMGDINRGSGVSGKPREDECSRYWVQRSLGQGQDTTIYDRASSDDQTDNVGTPPRMAANMNNESNGTYTDRVFLSLHTNAYDPGSLGLYNGNNDLDSATPNQQRLAYLVAAECNDDLSAIGSPPLENPWPNRRTLGRSLTKDDTGIEYGEINNNYINDEFDATLIEVAAHGNLVEAQNLLDAKARNWVARACYQALTRYFNEFGGGPLAFLPEPPTNISAVSDGAGGAVVSWNAPEVDSIGGDAATGYVVYRSANGYGFGNPVYVAGVGNTLLAVSDLLPGKINYFRVAAINAGGESMPTETVAVYPPSSGQSPILIVNGFDRLNRTMNIRETAASGIGSAGAAGQTYDRVKPRLMNSFDYVVRYADSLGFLNKHFDSCANETLISGKVNLSSYRIVIWILGEESTADETFSTAEQSLVKNFLGQGGYLFVSGTEIGYDLDRPSGPTADDRDFFNNYLMADYSGDSGGSYQAAGVKDSIFEGLELIFSPNQAEEIYDANSPDQITAAGTSGIIANYTGIGTGGAAIAFSGGSTERKVVLMGFPFECVSPQSLRDELMGRVMEYFKNTTVSGNRGWFLY